MKVKDKIKQKSVKQKLSEGGEFIGARHSQGGIKLPVQSTGEVVEVEGAGVGPNKEYQHGEFLVCNNAMNNDEKKVYEGKPREILSKMNAEHGCQELGEKADKIKGGESVINLRTMNTDDEVRCEGTPEGVASALNELGKGVKFSNAGKCTIIKRDLKNGMDKQLEKSTMESAMAAGLERGGKAKKLPAKLYHFTGFNSFKKILDSGKLKKGDKKTVNFTSNPKTTLYYVPEDIRFEMNKDFLNKFSIFPVQYVKREEDVKDPITQEPGWSMEKEWRTLKEVPVKYISEILIQQSRFDSLSETDKKRILNGLKEINIPYKFIQVQDVNKYFIDSIGIEDAEIPADKQLADNKENGGPIEFENLPSLRYDDEFYENKAVEIAKKYFPDKANELEVYESHYHGMGAGGPGALKVTLKTKNYNAYAWINFNFSTNEITIGRHAPRGVFQAISEPFSKFNLKDGGIVEKYKVIPSGDGGHYIVDAKTKNKLGPPYADKAAAEGIAKQLNEQSIWTDLPKIEMPTYIVEILNWKDLREQFGTTHIQETKTAIEIHRELKMHAIHNGFPENIAIPYKKKDFNSGEAMFTLYSKDLNTGVIVYEYNGSIGSAKDGGTVDFENLPKVQMDFKQQIIDWLKENGVDVSKLKFIYKTESPYQKKRLKPEFVDQEIWIYGEEAPFSKRRASLGVITETDFRDIKNIIKKDKRFADNFIYGMNLPKKKMQQGGDFENLPSLRYGDEFYQKKALEVLKHTFPKDKNRFDTDKVLKEEMNDYGYDILSFTFNTSDGKPITGLMSKSTTVTFSFDESKSYKKNTIYVAGDGYDFVNTYSFKEFKMQDGGKVTDKEFKKVDCQHQIFSVVTDNSNTLSRIFVRMGEHYDGSEFKDKIFTLEEFQEYWKKNHGGKFDYYDFWFGFNVPDYSIKSFVDGKFDPLLPEEKWLVDNIKSKVDTNKPYYIIGHAHGNDSVRKHEIAHALYYLVPKYKKVVNEIIDNIPTKELSKLKKFLQARPYDKSVYKDEMQAYLLADKKFLQEQNGWIDEYEKYRKQLNEVFDSFYTENKKEAGGKTDPYKTLVVIDVQPEYKKSIHWFNEFISLLNKNYKKFKNIVFLYNGRDTVGEMNEQEYKYWLIEEGLDEKVLDKIEFYDKGYAFFRFCMDSGQNHDSIVNLVKMMREKNINDSRELDKDFWDAFVERYGDEDIRNLLEHADDMINIPDLMDFINNYDNILLAGGAREECLKEVTVALDALDKKYKIYEPYIYKNGGDIGWENLPHIRLEDDDYYSMSLKAAKKFFPKYADVLDVEKNIITYEDIVTYNIKIASDIVGFIYIDFKKNEIRAREKHIGSVSRVIDKLEAGGKLIEFIPAKKEKEPKFKLNDKGGFDYTDEKDKKKAKRCGLTTLPKNIPGTNCSNCIFQKDGFCDHKEILLPVTKRMCCAFWDQKSIVSAITNLPKADFFPDKTKSTAVLNDRGGYDYSGKELERARKADLVTLPENIVGTNCSASNCTMYSIKEDGHFFCKHPKILLPVTERQSCGWYDNKDIIRPWGKPVENKFEDGGAIKSTIKSTLEPNGKPKEKVIKYKNKEGKWVKRILKEEDPEVIKARWEKKKERIYTLANDIKRLRNNISRDLFNEDEKIALVALIIAIQDRTAERIGNKTSSESGHFGVSFFRKKHVMVKGNKVLFCYTGKSGVDHEKEINDERICKAMRKAIKNSPDRYIFTTSDGTKITPQHVNDYLKEFGVNSKDIRGYSANKWMMDKLNKIEVIEEDEKKRKKQFNKALKQIAQKVGHGPATLRKHYLMPELIDEFINNGKVLDIKEFKYQDGGNTDENA